MSNSLRAGVVGCGAFGRNHARVYRQLASEASSGIEFAGVADADFARAQAVGKEFGTHAFRSAEELIAHGIDAASVAVPTVAHLEVARTLMQAASTSSSKSRWRQPLPKPMN